MNIIEELGKYPVVPVVKIDNTEDAVPIANALIEGGINCIEITFRTDCAKDAIKEIKNKFPQMLIGAGTILNATQVDAAIEAGADFIVSPGLNPKTVKYCKQKKITIIPGCMTPSEIEIAIENGLDVVKFFPAEQAGGIKMIKALAAPYNKLRFMPTGGIDEENIMDYIKFEKVLVCGGSFMVKNEFIKNKEFEKITEICNRLVERIG